MQSIAQQIGGEGGGHDGAAGWTGSTDRITAESSFIAHIAKLERNSE
jgi:nanoRNase/pAp phosphatase (c-di-AMP/oligoRNAs hydrolase)